MVIAISCFCIASRLACNSASRFSCKTSFLMRNKECQWLNPRLFVTHSRSSSSACAASSSFAQRSSAVAFALLLDIPFFCKAFFAWSVASKNCPICFDKEATVRPAASPDFSPARIVKGSIFTFHHFL